MKKIIVTTTINPPTEAIKKYDALSDWDLIVIGDIKTPKNYKLERGHYVCPQEQEDYDKRLSKALGWNCIQRRNIGFLMAYDEGADIVATIDDDNIPSKNWGSQLLLEKNRAVCLYDSNLPVFDPVGATNYPHLWHRGYPPQLIHKRSYNIFQQESLLKSVHVQADFWNGDPDIDAICRMEHRPNCTFEDDCFPLASNQWAPFNSQNTFLKAECLQYYFMFPYIGRMDDIWGAYYLQSKGKRVVFNKATVRQQRNIHDLTQDMTKEFLGYEKTLSLVQALHENSEKIYDFIPRQSAKAFDLYREHF